MTSPNASLTALVALVDDGRQLRQCLQSLRWFTSIIVISESDHPLHREEVESHGAHFLVAEEEHGTGTVSLWEVGLRCAKSPWVVLVRSNEIVTGLLRKTILQTSKTIPIHSVQYPLPRTTIYLQKRLKRALESRKDPRSALVYQPQSKAGLRHLAVEKGNFEGELIHYGAKTLADAWADWNRKAKENTERLAPTLKNKSTLGMFFKLLPDLAITLFDALIKQKAFKEGFEGAVWTVAELSAVFGGYLQYHEKYLRHGQWIKEDLESFQKILVIKMRDIGDNVLLLPIFPNLKKAVPQAKVSALTYDYSKPVFEKSPYIDEIYGLPKNPTSADERALIRHLNLEKFDLVINTHSGGLSTRILKKLNAPHKLNNHYIGRNKNYNVLVPQFEHYRSSTQRDLDCLRALGIEPETNQSEIFLSRDELDWARQELENRGFDPQKKLVVVHPTAAVDIRAWEIEKFGDLIQKMEQQEDVQVAVICSPAEFSKASVLLEYSPKLQIIHKTTVRQMMAIVHEAQLVVDNDSSPSHVAAAFGIPSVVLFSQAVREIFRPHDEKLDKQYVFYKDVDCRECGLTVCSNRICMDFEPEEVFHKCLEMLE
jgi:heptosyltransferase II